MECENRTLYELHGKIVGRRFGGNRWRAMDRHRLRRCRAMIDRITSAEMAPGLARLRAMADEQERIARKVRRTCRRFGIEIT